MRTFTVQVKTKQREDSVTESEPGKLLVKTKAMPIEGKANKAVIGLIAAYLGVAKQQVTIKSGLQSKSKVAVVDG